MEGRANIIPFIIIIITLFVWNRDLITIDLASNIILAMLCLFVLIQLIPSKLIKKINLQKHEVIALVFIISNMSTFILLLLNNILMIPSACLTIILFIYFYKETHEKREENES